MTPRRIVFEFRFSASLGQTVHLSGSVPELGAWDIDSSVPLQSNDREQWRVSLNLPNYFEYKYVILEKGRDPVWEGGPSRVASLPSNDNGDMCVLRDVMYAPIVQAKTLTKSESLLAEAGADKGVRRTASLIDPDGLRKIVRSRSMLSEQHHEQKNGTYALMPSLPGTAGNMIPSASEMSIEEIPTIPTYKNPLYTDNSGIASVNGKIQRPFVLADGDTTITNEQDLEPHDVPRLPFGRIVRLFLIFVGIPLLISLVSLSIPLPARIDVLGWDEMTYYLLALPYNTASTNSFVMVNILHWMAVPASFRLVLKLYAFSMIGQSINICTTFLRQAMGMFKATAAIEPVQIIFCYFIWLWVVRMAWAKIIPAEQLLKVVARQLSYTWNWIFMICLSGIANLLLCSQFMSLFIAATDATFQSFLIVGLQIIHTILKLGIRFITWRAGLAGAHNPHHSLDGRNMMLYWAELSMQIFLQLSLPHVNNPALFAVYLILESVAVATLVVLDTDKFKNWLYTKLSDCTPQWTKFWQGAILFSRNGRRASLELFFLNAMARVISPLAFLFCSPIMMFGYNNSKYLAYRGVGVDTYLYALLFATVSGIVSALHCVILHRLFRKLYNLDNVNFTMDLLRRNTFAFAGATCTAFNLSLLLLAKG
eukprot:TRINITY_DN4565_c0_g1_i2.p1 TRINITY_DN4565_c0_g1~~TRINITY_DN4565_c0_g1_i2.p1  ORF type:complete len:669 (+),score=190.97 TRINITY_DN4565_c0_g1_i2:56-2008(+)